MTIPKHLGFSFLIALAVVLTVHLLHFKGSVPDFRSRSGGGVLLDIKPSFSEREIYERLEGYGEEGRASYAFRNVSVDVLLPLALLHFLLPFMSTSLKAVGLAGRPKTMLLALPIAYVLFDLAENAVVLILLSRFPEHVPVLPAALPYVTVIKRAASILAVVIPPVLFGIAWRQRGLGDTGRKEAHMEKDPVCGMQVDPAKAAGQASYGGKTYYFCAAGCKAKFDKDPGQYAK